MLFKILLTVGFNELIPVFNNEFVGEIGFNENENCFPHKYKTLLFVIAAV